MANLSELLQEVVRAIIASTGNKPPAFRPHPRPVPAVQRMRHDRRIQQHRTLVARVLPSSS